MKWVFPNRNWNYWKIGILVGEIFSVLQKISATAGSDISGLAWWSPFKDRNKPPSKQSGVENRRLYSHMTIVLMLAHNYS